MINSEDFEKLKARVTHFSEFQKWKLHIDKELKSKVYLEFNYM